eukprot:scaffold36068_cov70-Phaeocystis_antarctica.AAC.1
MDASKLEPQPDEGDINNSETLDRAMLVSKHTPSPPAAHTKNRVRSRPTVTVIWPPGAHTNLSKGHTNLSKSQP